MCTTSKRHKAVASNTFFAPHLVFEELMKKGKVFGDACKTSSHKRVGLCSHGVNFPTLRLEDMLCWLLLVVG